VNGGLWLLIRLTAWGKIRFFARRAATVRGAISMVAVAGFFVFVVGSQFVALAGAGPEAFPRPAPDALRTWVPLVLLALLVLEAWVGKALAFTPQEIGFLFPAPLSRRELLAYHVVSRLGVRILSGLWASIFVFRYSANPPAAIAAVVLAMVFLHLSTELLALATAAAAAYSSPWIGRIFWVAVAASLTWSVGDGLTAAGPGATVEGVAAAVAGALPIALATLPMRPIAELYVAESARAALLWSAAVTGVIAVQAALLMGLDVAYTERSLATSRRRMERLRRMQTGEAGSVPRPWKLWLRVPSLRMLGPGAPLARRQLLEMLRNPRALLLPLLLPAMYVGIFVGVPLMKGERPDAMAVWAAVGMSVLIPILLPNVGFDFRRDLDRMAFLKGLPLTPFAVAAGQIFAPVALFAVAQWGVLASVAASATPVPLAWLAAPALLGPPLAWAMVATDNLLFLWMPYRVSTDGAQNVQFVGKGMLILFVKFVVLGVLGGLAAAAGLAIWTLAGRSVPAAALGAAVVLVLGCLPLTWGVGATFRAFDVTRDVPG
jgi:hypothetical protein